MGEFVVLLRAVNVGKRQLKMAEARKVLQDNDFVDVESHIQTGNFLVSTPLRSSAKVEEAVGAALEQARRLRHRRHRAQARGPARPGRVRRRACPSSRVAGRSAT